MHRNVRFEIHIAVVLGQVYRLDFARHQYSRAHHKLIAIHVMGHTNLLSVTDATNFPVSVPRTGCVVSRQDALRDLLAPKAEPILHRRTALDCLQMLRPCQDAQGHQPIPNLVPLVLSFGFLLLKSYSGNSNTVDRNPSPHDWTRQSAAYRIGILPIREVSMLRQRRSVRDAGTVAGYGQLNYERSMFAIRSIHPP